MQDVSHRDGVVLVWYLQLLNTGPHLLLSFSLTLHTPTCLQSWLCQAFILVLFLSHVLVPRISQSTLYCRLYILAYHRTQ
ncbi:hypothetical protein BJX66DRAFT_310657 [Aspergillus keveii]|uniref:Uncharacterized protein n=1 Tax=Aspergillus keveii TaxID=714993 RepID=A0ABR4FWE2_9EURO